MNARSILVFGLVLAAVTAWANVCWADEKDMKHPTGSIPPTKEQMKRYEKEMVRIGRIRPNAIGLDRINAHRRGKGKRSLRQDEVDLAPVGEEVVPAAAEAALSRSSASGITYSLMGDGLPSYVDNSTLPYFPPIRQQLGESCAAFSTTYYQMTHMTAMARGWNVKDSIDNTNKFSPAWIYNMINNGGDWGSSTWDAFRVQVKHGAAMWEQMPPEDGLFYWSTDAAVWRSAINYRMQQFGTLEALDTVDGREAAKALLNNGYVLNFSTYIGSWQYTMLKDDPSTGADDIFVGKEVCFWVNGTSGGHAMTIVGYNDDVWTDVNSNGVVDEGEKGAFRIANSWGDGWRDNGFVWFAYDGIGAVSQVSGAPTSPGTRREGWWSRRALYSVAYGSYRPKLLAQFTANHAARNELYMNLGLSTTDTTTPSSTWSPEMLNGRGGARAFDGSATACDGSFVLDFTDLAPSSGDTRRFYLGTRDSAAGNPATLSAYKLIDVTHGTETVCAQVPLVTDNAPVQYLYLDHYFGGNEVPLADAGVDIRAADHNLDDVETVTLDGSGSTDPDGTVSSYAWYEGAVQIGTGVTPDVSLSVGTHTITLVVTDDDNGTGEDSVLVTVVPGGVTLSYSGVDLSQDTGTMTIRCSDAAGGGLWEVDLKRVAVGYIVYMPRFDDLADGSVFNYSTGQSDTTPGLFAAHRSYYSGVFDVVFQELYKGADSYQYAVTCRRLSSGVEQWRTVTTYTISPATATGTQWTAEVVFTNTSGGSISGWQANNAIQALLSLGVGGFGSGSGASLSTYTDGLSLHMMPGGVNEAIWAITDNIDPTNGERQANQPAWGAGEVLDNDIAAAFGLTPGRSFVMDTDLPNNSTNTYNFDVVLEATRLYYKIYPNSFGQPTTIPADWTTTKNVTLDINITEPENVLPAADAGANQQVNDQDNSGYETVALDGGLSGDSDGWIASYVWTEGAVQIATGETASVSLSVGTHTITLTVTDDQGGTDEDTVEVVVNAPPTADAGTDQNVSDEGGDGYETVTLDGTLSSDTDGTIASYVWTEGAAQLGTGATADVSLSVGTHTITLTVTDDDGATAEDEVVVQVTPATATLSYTGADLAQGTGTMTIRCSAAGVGDLWELDLKRVSVGYIVYMPRLDDLTDTGNFNYASSVNDYASGLFMVHRSYYSGVMDVTFQELHKGSDCYQYAMTCRKLSSGVEQWRTVTTYTINPATATGTQWTAEVVFTNTSGVAINGWAANSAVQSLLSLGVGNYGSGSGATLSAYTDGLSLHMQSGGVNEAIWAISDNIDPTNDERQANQPAWGVGEVLDNGVTAALGLTPGRSLLMTTDLDNNSTLTALFDVALESSRLYYKVIPNSFGQPHPIPADWTTTKHMALDINITLGG
ncbi:MAG: hypothetical protein GXY74_15315 [Phycisphaerae bacterium]|nr:hypothetical protein [Phycisphaerae bacterium]